MPKVSVLIPSYNHADFIKYTIVSVLEQTYSDFEILICDDNSTDNSIEIIKQIKDNRIKLIVNSKNQGGANTLNKLIKHSCGEYIAIINSDDIWVNNKLEQQVQFLDNNLSFGAVFSHTEFINQDGQLYSNEHGYKNIFIQPNRTRDEWLKYFFESGNCLCHPSVLIRRLVYEEVGLYNGLMASLPDLDMWIRVCANYDIYVIQENLVKFRLLNNEMNSSGLNPDNLIREKFEHSKLLDSYTQIQNIELFNKIFNDDKVSNTYEIPFKFAYLCTNDYRNNVRYYGVNKLYELLLQKNLNAVRPDWISDIDFHSLVVRNDIFNVSGLMNLYLRIKAYDNSGKLYKVYPFSVFKNGIYVVNIDFGKTSKIQISIPGFFGIIKIDNIKFISKSQEFGKRNSIYKAQILGGLLFGINISIPAVNNHGQVEFVLSLSTFKFVVFFKKKLKQLLKRYIFNIRV